MDSENKLNGLHIYIALGIGVFFYFADAFVDGVLLGDDGFIDEVLFPRASELWVRFFVFALLAVFAYIYEGALLRRKRAERTTSLVLDGATLGDEKDFFIAVTKKLAEAYGARYAMICEFTGDSCAEVETISIWAGDGQAENVQRSLSGAPCEKIFERGELYYPDHVDVAFPKDKLISTLGVVSYRGALIRDGDKPLGILSVMDVKPMFDFDLGGHAMKVLAGRAASEIKLRRLLRERFTGAAQERIIDTASPGG